MPGRACIQMSLPKTSVDSGRPACKAVEDVISDNNVHPLSRQTRDKDVFCRTFGVNILQSEIVRVVG